MKTQRLSSNSIEIIKTKDYQDSDHPVRVQIVRQDGENRSILAEMNDMRICEDHGSLLYWANLFANSENMFELLETVSHSLHGEEKQHVLEFLESLR